MFVQTNKTPRKWTPTENKTLREKVEQYKNAGRPVCWPDIAAAFQGRSNDDCRKRWAKIDEKWRKGAWDSQEDELLRQGTDEFGYRWTDISKMVGTRSPDQCAKHWRNSLSPDNSHSEWTAEEDATLAEAVQRHGNDWKLIYERYFPERSRLDLSNRYVSLSRQEKKKLSRNSSFSATTHNRQGTNVYTESEPTFGPTSTGQGGGVEQQQQGTPSQRLRTSSINKEDATTSWTSQDFQTESLEAMASQDFALKLGRHEDLFPDINIHHETDNNNMLHNSGASSSSLYAFPDPLMSSEMYDALWPSTDHSPALSESLSLMQDARLSASDTNTWSTPRSDIVEGARPSPPCDDTSTMTPDRIGKTILTLENLDSDTRAEVVDLLCKRRIVTKIEML